MSLFKRTMNSEADRNLLDGTAEPKEIQEKLGWYPIEYCVGEELDSLLQPLWKDYKK